MTRMQNRVLAISHHNHCEHPREYVHQGSITLAMCPSQLLFDGNITQMWLGCQWSYHSDILHKSHQHSSAKFCIDHFIRIWMKAKWNLHHIWIVLLLVEAMLQKCNTGRCREALVNCTVVHVMFGGWLLYPDGSFPDMQSSLCNITEDHVIKCYGTYLKKGAGPCLTQGRISTTCISVWKNDMQCMWYLPPSLPNRHDHTPHPTHTQYVMTWIVWFAHVLNVPP